MRALPRLVALFALVAGAASCPPPESTVDARTFVTAQFQASVVCFPTFLATAEPIFLDVQSRAQIDIAVDAFNRDLANPNVTFDHASYDACLAGAVADDCEIISSANGPCAKLFVGTLGGEAVCAEGIECAPGLSCFQDRDACGVCRALALVGEDCSDRNCGDGDFCSDTSVCTEKPAPAQFNEGDPCTLTAGCGGVLSGLACLTNVCTVITVVEEGEACDIGLSATHYCKDSSSTHLCENNVCTKRAALGDACDAFGACDASEAACISGTCSDGGVDGDACTDGFGCELGFACKQHVCSALTTPSLPPTCG